MKWQRTERERTGKDGEPLHSSGLPDGEGRDGGGGKTGKNGAGRDTSSKHKDEAGALPALRAAPICT